MNWEGSSRKSKIDSFFISILFLAIFISNLPLTDIQLFSPDASGYLDMGRNLFSGKGAEISYNIYQFWSDRYHPFLPYMHPLFAVIVGLIWTLFGLKAVISFNILLLATNCALLYKIIRLNADCLTSFLIALFMGFSNILVFTAIFPWTEQLHLFFLMLSVFICLKYKKASFLVGVILAASCFVRVASFYNILAFAIALIILRGFSKEALREYTKMASVFLGIFLFYEFFCYFRYGVFYPEYLIASKTYRAAEIYSGAFYKEGFPLLNMPPLNINTYTILSNIRNHFADLIANFGNIKFVLLLAPLYAIFDLFKRRTPLFVFFFFQGTCVMLCYVLSLWWLPKIESTRFALIPFITLGSIGLLSVKEILDSLLSKIVRTKIPILFIAITMPLLYFEMKDYAQLKNYYRNIYPQQYMTYRKNRDEIYEWIKKNTKNRDLIASDFLADPFLFERPFVSLPPGRAMNGKNMIDFLNIYKPEYVLTYNADLVIFLQEHGFVEKKRKDSMFLLAKDQ